MEIVFLVFTKKNVAITIEHELQCNVLGIRTTTIPGIQQRFCFAHRECATADGRRSQPSAEKVPVRGAGRERWCLEIKSTYTAVVPGTRISGTRHVVPGIFSARCFGELDVAGEQTSRTSPQTFEQSYEKLCGDGHLSWALCP